MIHNTAEDPVYYLILGFKAYMYAPGPSWSCFWSEYVAEYTCIPDLYGTNSMCMARTWKTT